MNDKKGLCKCCNKERYYANSTLKLCGDCNYSRNHGGKNRFEVAKEKQLTKVKRKYSPRRFSTKSISGEKEMFLEIWEEREHICSNGEKCLNSVNGMGVYLGNEPLVHFFSHRKPKSTHPELRLCKDNIDLLCRDCHYKRDFR